MNRVDRLFGIMLLLQSKKYMPAEKISEKFDISVRTVYRDIKALCEQGIPISFEQHKGYFVVEGFFLPPISFSTEEAQSLLLIDAIVKGFADRSIQQHYTNVLNKVKSVLRHTQKEKVEQLTKNIRMQIPACINQDFEYLSRIQQAISSSTALEMVYKNNKNEINLRVVEPIGLVFYALGWHMIAWCYIRSDYRDFKVLRIMELKNTAVPFRKPDHIDLNEYMKLLPVNY